MREERCQERGRARRTAGAYPKGLPPPPPVAPSQPSPAPASLLPALSWPPPPDCGFAVCCAPISLRVDPPSLPLSLPLSEWWPSFCCALSTLSLSFSSPPSRARNPSPFVFSSPLSLFSLICSVCGACAAGGACCFHNSNPHDPFPPSHSTTPYPHPFSLPPPSPRSCSLAGAVALGPPKSSPKQHQHKNPSVNRIAIDLLSPIVPLRVLHRVGEMG